MVQRPYQEQDPPSFSVGDKFNYGRIGKLQLGQSTFETPLLFPVVCFITGGTPRGGGVWKYILQANSNGLMRRNLPVMSQVLHFCDFIPKRRASIEKWRKAGIRERYNEEHKLNYTAPIFFDSGGFQLLHRDSLDLSMHGLPPITPQDGFRTIVDLQREFGHSSNSNITATLDYPLPPGLVQSEVDSRVERSIDNAVQTVRYLKEQSDYQPLTYIAIHGYDGESIKAYVKEVFSQLKREHIDDYPIGLAVGSLVPLRGAKKYSTIVELLQSLQKSIPKQLRSIIPLHTFGITGNLIPILAYLGIDSFDSSTYIQEARGLIYVDPQTGHGRSVLELEKWNCDCDICSDFYKEPSLALREMQTGLTTETQPGKTLENGKYKSEYYGYIALHNLEMGFRIVEETRKAIKGDYLQDYLIKHLEKFPRVRPALDAIAIKDHKLRSKLSRVAVSLSQPAKVISPDSERKVSLKYTPRSFNILVGNRSLRTDKEILLIIPCSGGKPYSTSRSHQFITQRLSSGLNGSCSTIQKVTLSGLYGPVPEEYESRPAVCEYDFQLDHLDVKQINMLIDRTLKFLKKYGDQYRKGCVAYATSRAYRTVLEEVANQDARLKVLPTKPSRRRFTEFYRQENVTELVNYIMQLTGEASTNSQDDSG